MKETENIREKIRDIENPSGRSSMWGITGFSERKTREGRGREPANHPNHRGLGPGWKRQAL